MQLDALLEVAIGMVFVWLVLSVATLEIQNFFTTQQGSRAKNLEKAILEMLKSPKLTEKFYNHPLILELSPKDKNGKIKRPDYIPNPVFVTATLEVILNAGRQGDTVPIGSLSISEIRSSLQRLGNTNPALTRVIQHLLPNLDKDVNNLEDSIALYRTNIETWFNNAMVKATNVYKKNAAQAAFIIGLFLAILFNVDTINIAQKLWQDPTIREVLVAQAQNQSNTEISPSEVMAQAKELNFPIGWTTTLAQDQNCGFIGIYKNQFVIRSGGECLIITSLPNSLLGLVYKILGFLLSGFAASQGAPFWFDVLKKLVSIRNATQTTTTTSTPAATNTSTPATTTTSTQTTTKAPTQTTTTTTAPQATPPLEEDTPPFPDSEAVG